VTAACAGAPEPLWDAQIYGESEQQQQARHTRAKAVCATCPMRDECLATALIRREEGVWGGRLMNATRNGPPSRNPQPTLTDDERKARRKASKKLPQRCDQCGEYVQAKHMARHRSRWHSVAAAS
jgi:hypothetical protein